MNGLEPITPLALRALALAASHVGVMESPPASNRGLLIDAWQRTTGLSLPKDPRGYGNSWCMCFVYSMFKQAADEAHTVSPAIKSAGCLNVWDIAGDLAWPKQTTAAAAGLNFRLVRPGMIFIIETNPATRAGHTGFVEHVDYTTGQLTTIEGNSNELAAGNEGLGVFRLTRRNIKKINVGFINYTNP